MDDLHRSNAREAQDPMHAQHEHHSVRRIIDLGVSYFVPANEGLVDYGNGQEDRVTLSFDGEVYFFDSVLPDMVEYVLKYLLGYELPPPRALGLPGTLERFSIPWCFLSSDYCGNKRGGRLSLNFKRRVHVFKINEPKKVEDVLLLLAGCQEPPTCPKCLSSSCQNQQAKEEQEG